MGGDRELRGTHHVRVGLGLAPAEMSASTGAVLDNTAGRAERAVVKDRDGADAPPHVVGDKQRVAEYLAVARHSPTRRLLLADGRQRTVASHGVRVDEAFIRVVRALDGVQHALRRAPVQPHPIRRAEPHGEGAPLLGDRAGGQPRVAKRERVDVCIVLFEEAFAGENHGRHGEQGSGVEGRSVAAAGLTIPCTD